jgi:lipoyl(octanoyl) transferase
MPLGITANKYYVARMSLNSKTENPDWRISDQLVNYEEAVTVMEDRVLQIHEGNAAELVWLLEHPPLYTAGTSADEADLLDARFPVYQSGRGGEYTYHGPGQRVGYFMLDLKKRGQDVRKFIFNLEQVIIDTLKAFDVTGERREGRVGVWVVREGGGEDKIAAIGVRVRKWITYHGIAINVKPDLSHYTGIVPCGLSQFGITSLADLGIPATLNEVDIAIQAAYRKNLDL